MTPDKLRQLLPSFGLPKEAKLRLLNTSENQTWIAAEGTPHATILRVHRRGYHSQAEVVSELQWLMALQDHPKLRVVRPKRQAEILECDGQMVVGFEPILGQEPSSDDDLSIWFAELGEITAHLHKHSKAWPLPPGFARKRWDVNAILGPDAFWGRWQDAPGLGLAGRQVLDNLSNVLRSKICAYGTGPEKFGLIHADLRLANLLRDQAGLWVLDFDDSGFGWWMFDFAAAVSFIETDPRLPKLADLWCKGYTRVATLTNEDRAMLPVMVLLRRLQLTAWLASRAGNDTAAQFGGASFTDGTVALARAYLAGANAGETAESCPFGFWEVPL